MKDVERVPVADRQPYELVESCEAAFDRNRCERATWTPVAAKPSLRDLMTGGGRSMDNTTASAMHQHRHDSDEYRRIELITGSVRRRRWTAEEKATIIAESLQPKVNISELACVNGCAPRGGVVGNWAAEAAIAGLC